MIFGYIRGQELTLAQTVIAADTINYLTARFSFQTADWGGLIKAAHFACGELASDVELTDDEIRAEDGLNLTAGTWRVSVTGHELSGGEVVRRITTTEAELIVKPSGVSGGEPLPSVASMGEQILAEVENIHTEVDEQLDEQNAAVSEQMEKNLSDVTALLEESAADVERRLDENEAAVSLMLGAVKNRRDDSFLQLWAGTEAEYAGAEKSADTIYLIDIFPEGGESV